MDAHTTGSNNTAVGYESLGKSTTGGGNVAIGRAALLDTTTTGNNVAVGVEALENNTGSRNTAMGYQAGRPVTSGNDNISIGDTSADNLTTGSQNVLIGNSTSMSSASGTNQIVLGHNVTGNANGSLCFGDGATDSAIAFGATSITAPSDIRLKEDIQDQEAGLSFINDLRPVTFKWKKEKDIPSELNAHKEGSEKRTMNDKVNHGFIAQEVKAVIDSHNEIKDGFTLWSEDEADGRQRLGASDLETILVKAVQELSAKVEELENKLNGE